MPMPSSSPPDPPPSTTTTTIPRVFSNPQQPPSRPPTPSFPQSQQTQPHHRYRPPATYPHTQQYSVQAQAQSMTPRVPNSSHPQPQLTRPAHEQGILYPLASSGRGFLPKPNPGFLPRHIVSFPHQPGRHAQGQQHMQHLIRPTHLQHTLLGAGASSASGAAVNNVIPPGVVKGFPVQSKVAPPPSSVSDCNGYKDIRDRSRDDTSATVRDRKVRITDDASLYALCRSWLRNGYSEESQPQYLNAFKSLPRPLPLPVVECHSPTKGEADIEEEDEAVDDLSPQELLQRHVKRAKRVRSRLREERLRRISRYRTRLALLLPPVVEQQHRDDNAAENGNTE